MELKVSAGVNLFLDCAKQSLKPTLVYTHPPGSRNIRCKFLSLLTSAPYDTNNISWNGQEPDLIFSEIVLTTLLVNDYKSGDPNKALAAKKGLKIMTTGLRVKKFENL